MITRGIIALAFCALTSNWTSAGAGVVLTLSSPSDLSSLTVGQEVEIDLSLSGLPSPNNQTDFIFNLNTKILFPSSLFQAIPNSTTASGLTTEIGPGSAFGNSVQSPLQAANFDVLSSLVAGAANGIFGQTPNTSSGAIGQNGIYYSFMLRAVAAGTGSISFDSTPGANEYAANETGFNYAPLTTAGNLSFTINQATVPEPSSVCLLAIGVAALGNRLFFRRRSAV